VHFVEGIPSAMAMAVNGASLRMTPGADAKANVTMPDGLVNAVLLNQR
jgi:hypothetical protein